jgi:hypothetical protein
MKKMVYIMALGLLATSYNIGHCAGRLNAASRSSSDPYKVQKDYSHECQLNNGNSYTIGSGVSPSWLNQDEAICRSQKKYSEYEETLKVVVGKDAGDEEMRRLLVIKDIWENTPKLHIGCVLTVEPKNFMTNVPKEFGGLKLGAKTDAKAFMTSTAIGMEDEVPRKTVESDYLGNKRINYSMRRRSDYFKAYHFATMNSDGSKTTVKIVPSDDSKLQEEITAWKEADKGFFAKLTSNKVSPTEYYTCKGVDIIGGVKVNFPYYVFDGDDQLIGVWGYLYTEQNPSLQPIRLSASDVISTLTQQMGEPALKAKNEQVKMAIWVAKDGTRVDFLCWELGGYCTASSRLMVQKSSAMTETKASSAADFFK